MISVSDHSVALVIAQYTICVQTGGSVLSSIASWCAACCLAEVSHAAGCLWYAPIHMLRGNTAAPGATIVQCRRHQLNNLCPALAPPVSDVLVQDPTADGMLPVPMDGCKC